MLAVITGIPGSGKTTLTNRALDILKEQEIFYTLLNYGSIMFELAAQEGLVKNRDEMRKLNPSKQEEIQTLAAQQLSQRAQDENILLDTHCTISTKKGYIPGLPLKILKELTLSVLVVIESPEGEINERREHDASRQRDEESPEEIKLHQELNRAISMSYSTFTGVPVKIIQNKQGEKEKAAEKLAEILK